MALPAGITTCRVTVGPALDVLGDEKAVEVRFVPSLALVWVETGQTIESFPVTVSGEFIDLPHVDQAGFRDKAGRDITGWSYRVLRILTADRRQEEFSFAPVVGQSTIDLDLIPRPVAGSVPTVTPTTVVTSVDGEHGAIVLNHQALVERVDELEADTTSWAEVTGKPSVFPPVIGSGATEAVAGNDPRLTDARPPNSHSHLAADVTDFAAVAVDANAAAVRSSRYHALMGA